MAQQYNFDLNSAMKAGYTPDQIAQYLDQQKKAGNNYQLTQTPQATPQQSIQPAQPKSNFFADALPTVGSIVGGIGGAFLPVLGETGLGEAAGAAAGSGLGETAKELIEGQPLNAGNIAGQAVAGGVGGAVGRGVGAVGGKILSKFSDAGPVLEDVATGLKQGTRQIHVKPSVYGAGQEQAINNTLDKYGISGTAQQQYTQLQPAIQTIEGKINKVIADNPDAGASRQDIEDAFMKNMATHLRSKDMTAPQAKSEVNGYLDDLLKATPDSSETGQVFDANGNPTGTTTASSPGDIIPLGKLRQLKKLVNDDYDSISKKILTGGDLTSRQKVQAAAWDSLDSAVKNASPEVKGLLTDESNIYKSAQSLSAARSNPPTLRIAGTSVPANVTQTGRDIAAGAINLAGKAVGNTPGGLSPIISQPAGQAITRPFLSGQNVVQNTQNGQNNPQDNSQSDITQNNPSGNNNNQNLPPTPQAAFSNNSTISGAGSQALPATPQSAFDNPASTGTTNTNPLQGWTLNGQQINPAVGNLIAKIANYQIDPTKLASLKNNERERLIGLASQFDPSYDSSQFPVKQKIREDFTSGKSSQNIRSLNTAVSHLAALADAGGALDNTNFTPYNQIKNTISQTTGKPQVTRFNDSLNAVAGEMATVFKGTSGTDEEIKSWKDQMGSAQSPAQIQAGINQMIELMSGRLQALESQYQTGMGKPANFSFLNPNSQAILQKFGIDSNILSNPNALPATP